MGKFYELLSGDVSRNHAWLVGLGSLDKDNHAVAFAPQAEHIITPLRWVGESFHRSPDVLVLTQLRATINLKNRKARLYEAPVGSNTIKSSIALGVSPGEGTGQLVDGTTNNRNDLDTSNWISFVTRVRKASKRDFNRGSIYAESKSAPDASGEGCKRRLLRTCR
ncbi:MarR family transcriptional regulator [Anopheles sinensis]|uniref:MarR family transcriptional regulator n=1 Tax=Anopheles sinensis TaxID=74873 RepID=A0A084VYZ2_ANOSI|nr:MarR family transcriptional regulator [Anopheles sinensis]